MNFDFNIDSFFENLPLGKKDERTIVGTNLLKILEKQADASVCMPMNFCEIDRPSISIQIWRNLPDHAVQILERVGFSHYNKNTDSLELTDDFYYSSCKTVRPLHIIDIQEWGKEFSNTNLNNYIPTKLWKQLPDYATDILEVAGYTKYDRNTDSIVFVEK